jgi:hypothetical protein
MPQHSDGVCVRFQDQNCPKCPKGKQLKPGRIEKCTGTTLKPALKMWGRLTRATQRAVSRHDVSWGGRNIHQDYARRNLGGGSQQIFYPGYMAHRHQCDEAIVCDVGSDIPAARGGGRGGLDTAVPDPPSPVRGIWGRDSNLTRGLVNGHRNRKVQIDTAQ